MKREHGMSETREYMAWRGMFKRCDNKDAPEYPHYGGRGITICERWRSSFLAFFEDMGPRPSALHSIDRINNDGNYEPGNCRWATKKEQASNRRPQPPRLNSFKYTKPWEELGISQRTWYRMRKKQRMEAANVV